MDWAIFSLMESTNQWERIQIVNLIGSNLIDIFFCGSHLFV
jgi:hypothetical protein